MKRVVWIKTPLEDTKTLHTCTCKHSNAFTLLIEYTQAFKPDVISLYKPGTRSLGSVQTVVPYSHINKSKCSWCAIYYQTLCCAIQWRAESLGCPGPTRFLDAHQLKKYFFVPIHVKNVWRPFLVISQNFTKISTFSFSFLSEHLSGCRPLILDVRGRSSLFTHLPLHFDIYLCIFSENSVVGCPLGPSQPPALLSARHCVPRCIMFRISVCRAISNIQ